MSIGQQVRSRLNLMFGKSRMQAELEEELQGYEDLLAAEKVDRGLTPAQARREARLEMGGRELVRENVHDVWLGSALDSLLQDVRYALRNLANNPGFALAASVVLALGIGSATALFTTVNKALLQAIPFPQPDQLVAGQKMVNGELRGPVAEPDYYDFRERCSSFQDLAAMFSVPLQGTINDGPEPQMVQVGFVTWNLFRTLGVKPAAGRAFLQAEELGDGADSAILSYSLASRVFGGAPQAVGKALHFNSRTYRVAGVMPRGFRFLIDADIWKVVGSNARFGPRDRHNYTLIGRLKPGVSLRQAQMEADGLSKALAREYPATNAGKSLYLTGLHRYMVADIRTSLLVLLAASVLVLLIASGNVAGLLLARGQRRMPEMAMRTALGAPRKRLVRQLLTESVILTLFAGMLGIGVAYLLQLLLLRLLPLGNIQSEGPLVDGAALLFSLGASVAVGLLVGVVPALRVTASSLAQWLKTGMRSSEEARGARLRSGLVVLQVAVSAILLVGSATLIRTLVALANTNPGFAPEHVLTGRLQIQPGVFPTAAQRGAFFNSVLREIQVQPGVVSAAVVNLLPIQEPINDWPIWPASQPRPTNKDAYFAYARWISPDYFRTMHIPLLSGRGIADSDVDGHQNVIVLNKRIADRIFPNRNPIGWMVHTGWDDKDYQVVGVVADAHLSDLGSDPDPAFYLASAQVGSREMRLVVQTGGDPEQMTGALRRLLKRNQASILFSDPVTMQAILDQSMAGQRTIVLAAGVFSGVALLLTAVGLYGVLAYYVSQRRNELAIRLALGATRGRVLGLILSRGMALVAIGLALGAAGAYPEMQLIQGMVFGALKLTPSACLSAAAVLCGVSMAACLLPAWRASRGELVAALRSE